MPPVLRSRKVNPPTPPSKPSPRTKSKSDLIQSPLASNSVSPRGRGRGRGRSNASPSIPMISPESDGGGTKSEPERESLAHKKRKLDAEGGEFGVEGPSLSSVSGMHENEGFSGARVDDYKGKEVLVVESDEDGGEIGEKVPDYASDSLLDSVGRNSSIRFTREEKGKGIMMDCDPLPDPDDNAVDLELKLGVDAENDSNVDGLMPNNDYIVSNMLFEQRVKQNKEIGKQNASRFARMSSMELADENGEADSDADTEVDLNVDGLEAPLGGGTNAVPPEGPLPIVNNDDIVSNMLFEQRVRQNKEIAKQNASRFARASSMELADENGEPDSDADTEVAPDGEPVEMEEDWPGPFSTAMKIVKDRENKPNNSLFVEESTGAFRVIWEPNAGAVDQRMARVAPSLQELSMQVIVENSDAITSLKFVPDVMVHRLVSMLCDFRKMTPGILDLLFDGSPSEICISDCSWIEEEQIKKAIEPCNTGKLMVLQLDQCGRCMPDFVVLKTLAHKGLPVLTTLSLKGACRLSDDGLKALVSSAPALKSLNLSQCSLITETGVNALADSLRSGLHELYLDDCQGLNMMLLLPALERLTNLEVLSLVGIPSVSNEFIKQLIKSIGQNIKELLLADCVNLTDRSLKAISKNCSQLCALDLVNVTKLTDAGLRYLANCCHAIQTLKLCRNTFSDEAIAAFLEACGESLKELSLNNVRKVGPHTSISIARRCKNLVDLDVSWCRSLTDECLGHIADSCDSLRILKVFGCSQITNKFCAGHSKQDLLQVVGIKLTPILENLKKRDLLRGPLRYSAVFPSDA